MNDRGGYTTDEDELRVMLAVGYWDILQHPTLTLYPYNGKTGPDAKAKRQGCDWWTLVEVRIKHCALAICNYPAYPGGPVGVMINVSSVTMHGKTPFDFLVEDSSGAIYRAVIDPLTAATRYPVGPGRDEDDTGKQDCYYVPVEEFEEVIHARTS